MKRTQQRLTRAAVSEVGGEVTERRWKGGVQVGEIQVRPRSRRTLRSFLCRREGFAQLTEASLTASWRCKQGEDFMDWLEGRVQFRVKFKVEPRNFLWWIGASSGGSWLLPGHAPQKLRVGPFTALIAGR